MWTADAQVMFYPSLSQVTVHQLMVARRNQLCVNKENRKLEQIRQHSCLKQTNMRHLERDQIYKDINRAECLCCNVRER